MQTINATIAAKAQRKPASKGKAPAATKAATSAPAAPAGAGLANLDHLLGQWSACPPVPDFLDATKEPRRSQIMANSQRAAVSVTAINAKRITAPKPTKVERAAVAKMVKELKPKMAKAGTKVVRDGAPNERHATALKLLQRESGATQLEVARACDWDKVQLGKLAQTLAAKHGLKVRVDREGKGGTRIRLVG